MLFTDGRKHILQFLESRGARKVQHIKYGSLYDHLERVGNLLKQWGMEEAVVYAGLCHSLYSTEYFSTAVLSLSERDSLKDIIGPEAEELVHHFCRMKRSTLQVRENSGFEYQTHAGEESITISREQARALIHILLANEVDHMTDLNVFQVAGHIVQEYQRWSALLIEPARKVVEEFVLPYEIRPKSDEYVRFIGHAGVQLHTKKASLLIDPWLYPSTREKPRIQGFEPTNYTIDFLIPEPRNTIEELSPDIILLSHFHTHHAPLEEIKESASRKPITIVCPPIREERLEQIKKVLGQKTFDAIQFHFVREDESLVIGDISIRALYHNRFGHLAYLVTTEKGSIFHLSDPVASSKKSLEFDSVWEKFTGLNPDFAFVSCAGHAHRKVLDDGTREIDENETFTPTQAAKFVIKLGAKAAGAVGIHNHSVWTNRVEFSRTPAEAEAEFHWALSFLSPRTRVLTLRPGDVFPIGN